ncbi:tubulin-folding cofactor B [Diorhabda sublineata]|uniref:tubulin-folding cofactor B n=1 Tax=Diorhabda sublineata TaxID=1163346 RepID=UPI0024E0C74C|nr:tubulin-folding cofactor B [Diorhabda sublineata]
MAGFIVISSDFVNVHISTSKDDISFNEKRFSKDLTISDLKAKLELITGGSCNTMQIQAFDKDNKFICSLDDNNALLGSYPLDDGMRLHVVDNFIMRNELDFENIPKFELSQDEYAKKGDTVRSFLLKNKLGKYNEENIQKKDKLEKEEKALVESIKIGSRCKVSVQNCPDKLGTVMYAGSIESLSGYWIGVKYDEPLGKNDGSFKGKKYFDCPDKYGAFVKPHSVTCGDFPVEDYDLNEEI